MLALHVQLLHQLLDVHRQLVDKYGVVLAEKNSENQLSVVKSQKAAWNVTVINHV
jgi:hypothetical protein